LLNDRNESYVASIYCLVSEEFNGSWVRLLTGPEVRGKAVAEYDMERKGEWQKLKVFFRTDSIVAPVNFYFAKDSVSDFSTLRGYIQIAYPQYSKIRADSRDPESGWGSMKAKITALDTSAINELVPPGTLGYMLDRASNTVSWDNTAFSYSNISVLCHDSISAGGSEYFEAGSWCYVSPDFDGDWVRLVAEPKPYEKEYDEYNLARKGRWQKLNVRFTSETPLPPVYLYLAKYESVDFSKMNGFVIFAYPEYTHFVENRREINKVTLVDGTADESLNLKKGSLAFPLISLLPGSNPEQQVDSLALSEEQRILASLAEDDLAGTRKTRAYYSWVLFREYSYLQKLAGNGFDYQVKFGEKFGEVRFDYPHNPFLSAFLYSGVLGGIYYILYMLILVFLFIKHVRRHAFYAACFAAVLYFSFFSVNTHFTVTALAFLGLIPFLTRTFEVSETEDEDKIHIAP
jgi:hypothetical protein